MTREKPTGIKRIILACGHTIRGIKHVWKSEAAFRQEAVLAMVLTPSTLFLDLSSIERVVMVMSVIIVLIVEILNSAVEAAIDRISYDHHPLSGHAKDMGSAAVGVSLMLMTATWVIILFM